MVLTSCPFLRRFSRVIPNLLQIYKHASIHLLLELSIPRTSKVSPGLWSLKGHQGSDM